MFKSFQSLKYYTIKYWELFWGFDLFLVIYYWEIFSKNFFINLKIKVFYLDI